MTLHVALAQVRGQELVRLQNAINGVRSAEDITFMLDNLKPDRQIRVVRGNLKGMEGGYLRMDGDDFLVITLGSMGNAKVRVSLADCELKN